MPHFCEDRGCGSDIWQHFQGALKPSYGIEGRTHRAANSGREMKKNMGVTQGLKVVVGGLQKYTFSNKNEVILNKTPVS